jgi:hypothetical protein
MTRHERLLTLAAMDDILLDIATAIEPSLADQRITDNRYRRLKDHLKRPSSPLAPYLTEPSLIYAQGSVASSTTIVSGVDDDRFDVDAIVEMDVPANWSDAHALDMLEAALQGFPGAIKIIRCTRCIQLQFAFMHMDVTLMDRSKRIAVARAGEILHVPDKGPSSRVPSNPWGFTAWFRSSIGVGQAAFAEALRTRRGLHAKSRLRPIDDVERMLANAGQINLPPMIPSELDAQEAVALKLLKRHLNVRYMRLRPQRPPSIYFAKRAASVGYRPEGLTAQLVELASSTASILRAHVAAGTRPDELNPSYPPDRLNDRWPANGLDGIEDMKVLAGVLEALAEKLAQLARAPLAEIVVGMSELFGERIGEEVRAILKERFDTRAGRTANLVQTATGNVKSPSIARVTRDVRAVPPPPQLPP